MHGLSPSAVEDCQKPCRIRTVWLCNWHFVPYSQYSFTAGGLNLKARNVVGTSVIVTWGSPSTPEWCCYLVESDFDLLFGKGF